MVWQRTLIPLAIRTCLVARQFQKALYGLLVLSSAVRVGTPRHGRARFAVAVEARHKLLCFGGRRKERLFVARLER